MNIIFDFDGTIVDASMRFYKVYTDILKKYNKTILEFEEYWNLRRNKFGTKEIVLKTCEDSFIETYYKERIKRFEKLEFLEFDKLIYGKTKELLSELKKNNKLILVSLRERKDNLIKELQGLEILEFFDEILAGGGFGDYSDKVGLIKKLGYVSAGDVIIGDTESDIKCGKELGLTSIAVLSGLRNREYLVIEKPDFIIRDISELEDCLKIKEN